MHDTYSDDYSSVAIDDRLIPEGARRLAGAAVFVALVAGMGLWSYRLGTRDAGQVPVIKAIDGPARIQPEDPGGLQAAHQGLEVNRVLAGAPARPAAAVAAKPAPSPMTAEDEPQGELVTKAPAALAERLAREAPPEAAVAPDLVVAAVPADADPEPATLLGDADVATDEEAVEAAAGPRPRSRPANLSFARASAPAAERPATAERPAAAKPAALATAAVATAALPKPTPAVASAPAATAAPRDGARPATGARLVQLGAFDNEAMAKTAWNQLLAKNGDILGSKSLYVERTTANARVFYRLRVAGFSNADQTRQMCEQLRSRGIACIPVTLQ